MTPRAALHALFGLSLALAVPAAAPDDVKVVVLHTNDLHGQLLPRETRGRAGEKTGGFAAIDAVVARERAAAKAEGAHVLLVDSGDWFQGTPEGNHAVGGAAGALVVDWMSRAGYDAVAIGNHEFDFGLPNLHSLLARAKFPALAANVRGASADSKPLAKPFVVHERGGVRLAFVGLLTDRTPTMTPKGALGDLAVDDEIEAGRRWFDAARKESDLVFFVTHCGKEPDEKLARRVPESPAIFGGHSHTRIDPPQRVEHEPSALASNPWKPGVPAVTYVLQTGSKAQALDRLELLIDPSDRKIRKASARLVPLDLAEVGEDAGTKRWIEEATAPVAASMAEVIAAVEAPPAAATKGARTDPTHNFVTDALLAEARALDPSVCVALTNRSGIRTKIETGPFTRRTAYEIVPFDNSLTMLTLAGRDFAQLLRESFGDGESSKLVAAGLTGTARRGADGAFDFSGLAVGGKPFDPAASYRVVTVSFLADGKSDLPAFTKGADRKDTGRVVRDVLESHAKKLKTVVLDDALRFRGEAARRDRRTSSRPAEAGVGSAER